MKKGPQGKGGNLNGLKKKMIRTKGKKGGDVQAFHQVAKQFLERGQKWRAITELRSLGKVRGGAQKGVTCTIILGGGGKI